MGEPEDAWATIAMLAMHKLSTTINMGNEERDDSNKALTGHAAFLLDDL